MLGIGVGIGVTLAQGGGIVVPTAAQVAANLFGAGEPGLMLSEFNTFSNLFQDGPGTTPVTAVGQPVGRANDLSGRGNFATFSNCTLQQDGSGRNYLASNGTSTSGVTASIDFTGTAQMTIWAGINKASDAATGTLVELSANSGTNAGAFEILAPFGAAANVRFQSGGSSVAGLSSSGIAAPIKLVLACQANISAPLASTKVNGAAATSTATTQGTGNFGNYQLFIGSRGGSSVFFSGNIYCLIVRGAATTAPLVSSTELYVNGQTGAF